jgi:prephenate dehydratase
MKPERANATAGDVAYLGPEGTYSHLVAEKRYPHGRTLVPLPTIMDVCAFVAQRPTVRRGVIPIENSSGGAIYETVDILLGNLPPVCILEELALDVKLALLGRKGEKVKVLYSHFAPIEHCMTWLARRLPGVERRLVATTAIGAQRAAVERNAAALGSRRLARLWALDVLRYPVQADVPNITVFLVVGGTRRNQPRAAKTTLAVKLPNQPGALCAFLETFRDESVNLSRLISRPIRGCPREYAFLVDVDGAVESPAVKRALKRARGTCAELRTVGSYPTRHRYTS